METCVPVFIYKGLCAKPSTKKRRSRMMNLRVDVCLRTVQRLHVVVVAAVIVLLFSSSTGAQTSGDGSSSANVEVAKAIPPKAPEPTSATPNPQEETSGAAQSKV